MVSQVPNPRVEAIEVISARVAGASHKLKNADCQDAFKVTTVGDVTILAAADGHGSEACKHSKVGAEIAVEVFCKVMRKFCTVNRKEPQTLRDYLTREGGNAIAKAIDSQWKARVDATNPDDPDRKRLRKSHGTTLLGLMLTPTFVFALQIGDGDILLIHEGGVTPVIAADKILGIETHSLSRENAWEKALATVAEPPDCRQGKEAAFMLATDGFANSYPDESAFHDACRGYFAAIKEHGAQEVQTNLNRWLEETSESGSGDDITVLFAVHKGKQEL